MRQVRHLLDVKGDRVFSVRPDDTVFTALSRMAEHGIGSLVVLDGDSLVGVFSERDYARKVVLRQLSSAQTPVAEVMSAPVISVAPEATIEECMRLCTDRRIRHLPVLDGGKLAGLVSIGDLVKALLDEKAEEIEHLRDYIAG